MDNDLEYGFYAAAGTAAAAGAAAGGLAAYGLATGSSILVEGVAVGGSIGSGGLMQLRPERMTPWIRLDFHRFRPGGWRLPHIDSPPFGMHHWPWER